LSTLGTLVFGLMSSSSS